MKIASFAYRALERGADLADAAASHLPAPVKRVVKAVAVPAYLATAGVAIGGTFGLGVGLLGGPLTAVVAGVNGAIMGGGLGLGVGSSLGAAMLLGD